MAKHHKVAKNGRAKRALRGEGCVPARYGAGFIVEWAESPAHRIGVGIEVERAMPCTMHVIEDGARLERRDAPLAKGRRYQAVACLRVCRAASSARSGDLRRRSAGTAFRGRATCGV